MIGDFALHGRWLGKHKRKFIFHWVLLPVCKSIPLKLTLQLGPKANPYRALHHTDRDSRPWRCPWSHGTIILADFRITSQTIRDPDSEFYSWRGKVLERLLLGRVKQSGRGSERVRASREGEEGGREGAASRNTVKWRCMAGVERKHRPGVRIYHCSPPCRSCGPRCGQVKG